MRKQARKYWCGPASIQNALEALGERVTQREVAALCGTDKDGTTEFMLMAGLAQLGYDRCRTINTDQRFNARSLLEQYLRHQMPVLLCVDDWGHWVTLVTPPLGERFTIVDPLEGSIRLIHWKRLERRWRTAAMLQTATGDKTYYAISIGREIK